ncbi:efflux RND transporter permease subunit [Desulfoplanes formicivorans]|uniref:Multidrug transporter AcrB n=1 Tax=Desulfoplanes formicivorans TaxID=1592317 RepID=A0A194AGR7_9BACT|nr:efflux RND transporter permease subunit [Desulfoplanes formicivorans]GAU08276.1 multidrug transporter AcrB [Desulfoplanes formicivorans]
MNLTQYALGKRTLVIFATLVLTLAGIMAQVGMGKLEDPEFSIKTAMVTTTYAGASALEVEQEVTDILETSIQRLPSLDHVRSLSTPGHSRIWVDFKESFRKKDLPQLFDNLRKKVAEVANDLPPGAGTPVVEDDFGDVYGIFLAVVSHGLPHDELKDYADDIRRELLLVKDVARIELWGNQPQCIWLEVSRARMDELGIPFEVLAQTLGQQNLVVDSGHADLGQWRIRMDVGGTYNAVTEIGNQVIRSPGSDTLVRIRDIAKVKKGYLDPPVWKMRFDGKPAIGLAISTVSGGNVVDMGKRVRARLDELIQEIPLGLSVETVAFQPELVQASIEEFMLNLVEAVVIVIALLLVCMGLSSGLLIGVGLVITICITFGAMYALGLTLDRVTLGALIVALGMLVDNAIVVTEGMLVKMQRGMSGVQAGAHVCRETAWPLLGATLVAALAFLPIFLSPNNVGEYCVGLFKVVSLSLGISWILALTVTPILCDRWLNPKVVGRHGDPYAGRMFGMYRKLVGFALGHRTLTIGIMIALFVAALQGFSLVKREFFPESRRAQLMIDYWRDQGTDIRAVDADLKSLERALLAHEHVTSVATFVGAGPHRFYLPLEPQVPNTAYGYLLLNLDSGDSIPEVRAFARTYLTNHFPQADPRVRRFPLGSPSPFKIATRFRGPDPVILHQLADQATAIMRNCPLVQDVRDDWRNRVLTIVPQYDASRGLLAGTTRQDVAGTLKRVYEWSAVGLYREHNRLIPIMVRPPAKERQRMGDLLTVQVRPVGSMQGVPLATVVNGVDLTWEESQIRRYDHQRCITAQCDPIPGVTMSEALQAMRSQLDAIKLPPGYTMEWGGSVETSQDSTQYVLKGVPLSFLLMALVVVALFNGMRQPLIILCILPLALIGVSLGLLATDKPFGFMALLGFLSLAGMLIKNAVVLLDQMDAEIRGGKDPYQAILDSAVSRMRPVLMAAISTVLGMTPLIFDRFWVAMAVTICFGLTFATVLTLIVVPVLYAVFFRIKTPTPTSRT